MMPNSFDILTDIALDDLKVKNVKNFDFRKNCKNLSLYPI